MVDERRTKLPQLCKAHVGVSYQRRTVLIDVGGAGSNDGEAVVGRGDASRLHLATHYVVDEGGLA